MFARRAWFLLLLIGLWFNYWSTYTCPSSWAMVKAAESPLSWTMAQDFGLHIVPNSANPNVSQFVLFAVRQICSLKVTRTKLKNVWKSKWVLQTYLVNSIAVSCGKLYSNCFISQNDESMADAETPIKKNAFEMRENRIMLRYLPFPSFWSFTNSLFKSRMWTTTTLIELPILASA